MKYKLQVLFIPNNSILPADVNAERIAAKLQALETQAPIPIEMVAAPAQPPVEPTTV